MKRKIKEILSGPAGVGKKFAPRQAMIRALVLSIMFCSYSLYGQNARTVSGLVVDTHGEPVIGASVVVKEMTTVGVITNTEGRFTIQVPAEGRTLLVQFLGMVSQEVDITGKTSVNVTLEDDNLGMEEIVVVGYGQQRKESIVGAITQTTGKILERAGGVSSVGAALTGNLPGVVTTSSTGMPGEEDPQIIIRGRSSWNNSDPLVLVDGVERPMTGLDIQSVETISVLKDASATAVFGVRGANGVILITTKRGVEGRAAINVGVNTTMKVPSKLPGKYDSYDALMIRNRAIEYELGLNPESWADITPQAVIDKYRYPANLEESERYPNVDWADALFKNFTMSYNANVNVSGGTKFVKYFAAADYLHEGDLFKVWNSGRGYNAGYGYDRLNVRSNLDFSLTNTTLFKVNLSGSHGIKKSPWGATGNEYTIWQGAYSVAPDVFLPQYSDGTWGYYPNATVAATNSAANLALGGRMSTTTTRINTDFTLEQDLSMLVEGLSVRGMVSWDNVFVESSRGVSDLYNSAQSKWIDPATGEVIYSQTYDNENRFDFQEGIKWSSNGGSVSNWLTQRNLTYQFQINYAASFGRHNVTAMGAVSREERNTDSAVPSRREDWVFRGTYDFDRRYFLDYSGSYNGSEKFSPDNRFAFFQSVALGWMLSEEKFMKDISFLDMLKLRGSYGTIGDDNVAGRFLYLTQWAYNADWQAYMGLNRETSPYSWYREASVGTPDVHWETVKKSNLGVDFGFLRGKITGQFDYFSDTRTDILLGGSGRSVPTYFGMDVPYDNLGKVRTKGYEVELRFTHTFKNGVRLWANGNMTHAKDRIIKRDDGELLPDYQKQAGKQMGQTNSHISNGYYNTWDQLYGTPMYDQNDSQKLPGGYIIIDYNGDGVVDSYDSAPYAFSNIPQNTYNGTIGIDWKGFSAFLQFYGVNNVTRQVVFTSFSGNLNTVYREGSYWSMDNTNPDSPMPRWKSQESGYSSGTRYYYDGSYIRLKNAEVSYTWNTGWVNKIGIQSLRLYFNGNNLWVWSRMPDDRESNFAGTGWASQGAYPTMKRFNIGLQITL